MTIENDQRENEGAMGVVVTVLAAFAVGWVIGICIGCLM